MNIWVIEILKVHTDSKVKNINCIESFSKYRSRQIYTRNTFDFQTDFFRVLDCLSKFREGDQIKLNLFHHQNFFLIKSLILNSGKMSLKVESFASVDLPWPVKVSLFLKESEKAPGIGSWLNFFDNFSPWSLWNKPRDPYPKTWPHMTSK